MQSLIRTLGALPFLIAVFLNAFVDLGHKIVIQNTIFKVYDGPEQVIFTAIVNALILLPFIILFSPAGFVSDKYPKKPCDALVSLGRRWFNLCYHAVLFFRVVLGRICDDVFTGSAIRILFTGKIRLHQRFIW